MEGKIIKGIAGFYYVHVTGCGVYECKAKGIFRNKNIRPLVGDNVEIDIIDDVNFKGNITDILPRNNELIRPAVANIDQSLVVFASLSPAPNFNLLSRFLCMMEYNEIPTVICFNKTDQIEDDRLQEIVKNFEGAGCRILMTSTVTGQGLSELREVLEGKTTALAGPSGVGKSSMLNAVYPDADVKTGEISEKINRGKHTTRHTEIFHIEGNTYVMDTPGFTSLYTNDFEKEELKWYFPEFREYEGKCRFNGCIHENEPDCAVKNALEEGKISESRYKNYLQMLDEIKNRKKY